jgi:hypothetical protein
LLNRRVFIIQFSPDADPGHGRLVRTLGARGVGPERAIRWRFVSGEEMNEFFAFVLREQGGFTGEAPGDPVQERRPGRDDNQGEKK